MSGQKVGPWIGVVGGLIFVVANAGGLPDQWPVVLRIVGVVVSAVVAIAIVRAPVLESEPPTRRAIRIYGWCVTAMVIAIPVGATLLNGPLDMPELTVVWVVGVVGAHFWPFAAAFDEPVFRPLALTLMAVAIVGGVVTVLAGESAAAATAVIAGFVLLAFAAQGTRVTAPR